MVSRSTHTPVSSTSVDMTKKKAAKKKKQQKQQHQQQQIGEKTENNDHDHDHDDENDNDQNDDGGNNEARPSSSGSSTGSSRASSLPRPLSASASSQSLLTPTTSPSKRLAPSGSSQSVKNDKGNVKVVVRVRPLLEREQKSTCLISMDPKKESTTITAPANARKEPKEFFFDHCYWSLNKNDDHFVDQGKVYDNIGQEFLDHNMEGYNTCIFAYGQTGSGKSFTMMGSEQNPGIIPRTCQDLFERLDSQSSSNVSCTVRISYFEVYNEQVRDLLAKKNTKLRVRESPTDGPYVEDLAEFSVQNVGQVLKYLEDGNKARATASTKMNDMSSRSHAVFTLVVRQMAFDPDTDNTEERTSRLRLVDLAGSERANASGAQGARLKEGSNINKSLSTLGRVIAALAAHTESNSKQIIPYRDSVLTWLLKESLGGNSKTAMVACISPTDYEETLSTLRYADQAKQIKTRAVINQDVMSAEERDALVEEMQERINTLQESLTQYSSRQEEDAQFKQEMEKVRAAVRFYEERAIIEENKRKAIQMENMAFERHNRLLRDHLKEVTNRNVGLESNNTTVNNDGNDYDSLKRERDAILEEVASFKSDVAKSRQKFTDRLARYGTMVGVW